MKIRIFALISYLLLNTAVVYANDVDQAFMRSKLEEYHLNHTYKAGRNLIYDCVSKHYACVDTDSFENCQNRRRDDYITKSLTISCAPIGKFDSKENCVLKNYELQSRKILKKFCFNN